MTTHVASLRACLTATLLAWVLVAACGSDDDAGGGTGLVGAQAPGGGSTGGSSSGGHGNAGGGDGGAQGGSGVCEPVATEPCDCTEGVGSRRCAADGSGWSGCECAVYGAELAVSPEGSDSNAGTLEAPFATLGRARDAVAELVAAGLVDGGVVVWLREGSYALADTLVLGTEHSGSEGRPVVWRGYPGERARVLGGQRIAGSAFAPVTSASAVFARLEPAAQAAVVSAELGTLGISDYGAPERRGFCHQASMSPLELFVDGTPMTLARWPDLGEHTVPADLEHADSIELYGTLSPDVTGHYIKEGEQDSVSSFARDGLVGGLQYHLYRLTWDYQGSTYTAWFLTSQASGYPGGADPWWSLYSHELGTLNPSNGASGLVSTRDPEALNHGFATIGEALSDTSFRYVGSRPERWVAATEVWFHGFWEHAWADCHAVAASIDTASKTVTLGNDVGYGIKTNQPYYAYDLPEELTAPGEWWLDRSTGTAYLWPPAELSDADIVVSTVTGPLIRLQQASHVELRDLTLEASRAELVRVDEGTDDALVGLNLRNAGTNAAVVSGTRQSVRSCHVSGTGNGGVRLSGGDRAQLSPGESVIEQSHFHDLSRWEWTYRPAISLSGAGLGARHNLIHDAPHSAILYSGNEHDISLNEIHDVCQFSSDAGAIYAGRDWGARGNVIRHNFIHHVATWFEGYGVHGVYLDDCLSGVRVEGNVIYDVSGHGILHGGGRDDIMVNNVIARSGRALSADARGIDWQPGGGPNNTPGDSWNLLEKLVNLGYQSEPWASRYPECAAIPNDWNAIIDPGATWLYPEDSVFSRNVGFGNNSFINGSDNALSVYASLDDNLEDVDPLFVDEAGLDLSLQATSPAYDLPGFEPIPFEEIGIVP